jgi:hypothetical protein
MLDTLKQSARFRNAYLRHALRMMTALRAAEDGFESITRVVPDAGNIAVAANGTYEAKITVPDQSRLWSISASSEEAEGFDIQIRNLAIAQPLFGGRLDYRNASGHTPAGDEPASQVYMLPRPLLCLAPDQAIGRERVCQMAVQIWNKAAAVNTIQVVLWFAAPKAVQQ